MAHNGEDEVFEESLQTRRLVVIGKTGNGKSSVGNMILGQRHFQVGCSMTSTTLRVCTGEADYNGVQIKVLDTPDITNLGLVDDEAQREVSKWKALASPEIHAVLLAVRCDVRYTREEHEIYLQLKRLWGGKSLARRLVVAFTFGDRQDADIEKDLERVCPELKSVLKNASKRYVVFNDKDDDEGKRRTVDTLLKMVQKIDAEVARSEQQMLSAVQVCPQGPLMMVPCILPPRSLSSGSSTSRSRGSSSSDKETIRLLLVGKTGTGKSSTGNTIIGREVFPVNNDNSSPHASSRQDTKIGGYQIQVVDTPGLQMNKETDMDIRKERIRASELISPGPHAIIFVLRHLDVNEEDLVCFNTLQQQLETSITKYIILALVGVSEVDESAFSQLTSRHLTPEGPGLDSASPAYLNKGADGAAHDEGVHGEGQIFSTLLKEAGGELWLVDNQKTNPSDRNNQVHTLMKRVQGILDRSVGACCEGDQNAQGIARTRHSSGRKSKDNYYFCSLL